MSRAGGPAECTVQYGKAFKGSFGTFGNCTFGALNLYRAFRRSGMISVKYRVGCRRPGSRMVGIASVRM